MARMVRAGKRVGFGKILDLGLSWGGGAGGGGGGGGSGAGAGGSYHAACLEGAGRIEPLSTADHMSAATASSLLSASRRRCPQLGRSDVEIRPPKDLVKREPLRLEPIGGPRPPSLRRALEAISGSEGQGSPADRADRRPPSIVRAGDQPRAARCQPRPDMRASNGESVANDRGAARERRQNRLVEMVDTGGGEQECLPSSAKIGCEAGKDRAAQRLRAGEPPGSRVRTTATPSAVRCSQSRLA